MTTGGSSGSVVLSAAAGPALHGLQGLQDVWQLGYRAEDGHHARVADHVLYCPRAECVVQRDADGTDGTAGLRGEREEVLASALNLSVVAVGASRWYMAGRGV